ncbi:MAG: helix-turn-helix domain-containing protein [Anaerolineae bacterium]
MLKVHPETVRNWIRRGDLAAIRVGRNWRIKWPDLERIAERGTEEVQP